jgi:hypothetical protein
MSIPYIFSYANFTHLSWRWRQQVPPKRWYRPTRLACVVFTLPTVKPKISRLRLRYLLSNSWVKR